MKKVSIEITKIEGECSKHRVGDKWYMENGTLYDPDQHGFCIYALNSILPMLPLKEAEIAEEDHWIHKYVEFICPDVNGRAFFKLEPADD